MSHLARHLILISVLFLPPLAVYSALVAAAFNPDFAVQVSGRLALMAAAVGVFVAHLGVLCHVDLKL